MMTWRATGIYRHVMCLSFIVLALSAGEAFSQGCLIPVGPTQTSKNDVLSLYSYADGSTLCIHDFDPENSCAYCKSGFEHECRGGWWYPTTIKCDVKDAVKPKDQGPQGSGGESPTKTQDQPNSERMPPIGRHKPDPELCGILGTC